MSEHEHTIKTCPRCGRRFECLHATGCWCFEYEISPEKLEELKNTYSNCLCPDCLPEFGTRKGIVSCSNE